MKRRIFFIILLSIFTFYIYRATFAFQDDLEGDTSQWTNQLITGTTPWNLIEYPEGSNNHVWYVPAEPDSKEAILITPTISVGTINPIFRFHIQYLLEGDYDGLVVEFSTDSGASWQDLGDLFISGGYNTTIAQDADSILAGRHAFSWNSNGDFITSVVDLSDYAGMDINIRFRLICDSSKSPQGAGVYIDDLELVENTKPLQPYAISPQDGATNQPINITLVASDFIDPDGNNQLASRWVIAKDSDFQDIVFDSGIDVNNLNSITIEGLDPETTYYWYVVYVDEYYAQSDPSSVYSFTTARLGIFDDAEEDYGLFSVETDSGQYGWQRIESDYANSPTHLWYIKNDTDQDSSLVSIPFVVPGGKPALIFYHYIDSEENYDGGKVEIRPLDSDQWIDLKERFLTGGYNSTGVRALESSPGYSGNFGPVTSKIDLSDFVNQVVQIRFRFASDTSISRDGWYVDDIEIIDMSDPHPPQQPINLLPIDGSTGYVNVVLVGDDYYDQDGDSHSYSQWQVAKTLDFSSPIFDSGKDHNNLTYIILPPLPLSNLYYWRVRYCNERDACSPYSNPTSFSTIQSNDIFYDDIENGDSNWTHQLFEGTSDWQIMSGMADAPSPTHVWYVEEESSTKYATLTTRDIQLPQDGQIKLQFYHRMLSEQGYDGGYLMISVDGSDFVRINSFVEGGYNDQISDPDLGTIDGWSGSVGESRFQRSVVDLSDYRGSSIKLRFVFVCDSSLASGTGWYIDNVWIYAYQTAIPERPTNISPVDEETLSSFHLTLQSSPFLSSSPDDHHLYSHWQIALDPDFNDLVVDTGLDPVHLTSLPFNLFYGSTTYFWRVSYINTFGIDSGFSNPTSFVTPQGPSKPSNLSPSDGSTDVSFFTTLVASPFDPDYSGGVHKSSRWQVALDSDFQDIVFDSEEDEQNLTNIKVELDNELTTYYWRVRYRSDEGVWSEWSDPTSFTTRSYSVTFVANGEDTTDFDVDTEGTDVTGWALVDTPYAHSPTKAWFSEDEPRTKNDLLIFRGIYIPPFKSFLEFWHTYQLETGYDFAKVLIRPQGQTEWTPLFNNIIEGNPEYTDGWSGGVIGTMERVKIDLSEYQDRRVDIGFLLSCDSITGDAGWYVDDIRVYGTKPDGGYLLFNNQLTTANLTAYRGSHNKTVMWLHIWSLEGSYTLRSLNLKASGTGDDAGGIDQVYLINDKNHNGINDGSDEVVFSSKYDVDDGTITVDNLNLTIDEQDPLDLLVSYDFSTDVSIDDTFMVSITDYQSVSVDSDTSQVTLAGLPVSGEIVIVNGPPVIVFSDDNATYGESDTVILDASGSYDPDNDDLTVTWTQIAGPRVELTDPESLTPTFTAPSVYRDTNLSFNLMLEDTEGNIASDTYDIIVLNTINDPPVADAGQKQILEEEAVTFLDASGSYDPNGDPITFLWTQIAGPEVNLSDPTSPRPSLRLPRVDQNTILKFRVLVKDPYDATSTDEVEIWEKNSKNAPPVPVIKAEPKEGAIPLVVEFDATDSYDPDGEIVFYQWDFGHGAILVGSKVKYKFDRVGLFSVTLIVTDDHGNTNQTTTTIKTTFPKGPTTSSTTTKEDSSKGGCSCNGSSSDPSIFLILLFYLTLLRCRRYLGTSGSSC